MATPETRNEHIAPTEQMGSVRVADSMIPSFVAVVISIGLLASFLVALIGFLTDRYTMLVAGAIALSVATFVWVVVAVVELGKTGAIDFVIRRVFRRGSSNV